MIVEAAGWELEPAPWVVRAACAGRPTEQWFVGRGQSTGPAKAVCAACPVRVECLAYALRWDITVGVWGGLSPAERRGVRRGGPGPRRLAAAHGTTTRYARGCRCDGCGEAKREYQTERRAAPR